MAAAPPPPPFGSATHHLKSSHFRSFSFPSTLTPLLVRKPLRLPLPITSFSTTPLSSSFPYSFQHQKPELEKVEFGDEDHAIGDCLVFEEGAFEGENPFLPPTRTEDEQSKKRGRKKPASAAAGEVVEAENLVPEKWKEAVAEINLTKKEKRVIARELKFGSKVERRKQPGPDLEEYLTYRKMKLSQLKPVVLNDPVEFPPPPPEDDLEVGSRSRERAVPKNPRLEVEGEGLDRITEFFNTGDYVPGGEIVDDKKPKGSRKLFTQEEKVLLNKRVPTLADATSRKWLPVHTFAASGEFYLLDLLLKHNVDINAADSDGLCAIHKAILGKKQAILNYLLRESANPFVHDNDGATLMHCAVQTASIPAIKILILYNVDINLSDNDGWTPLHLAVQTQRTDIVKLLLIKGADKTLKNKDGLTPLDLCLYSGKSARTYEIIKLLKMLPRSK